MCNGNVSKTDHQLDNMLKALLLLCKKIDDLNVNLKSLHQDFKQSLSVQNGLDQEENN